MKQRTSQSEYDVLYARRYLVWRRGEVRRLKRAMNKRLRRDGKQVAVPAAGGCGGTAVRSGTTAYSRYWTGETE